MRLPPVEDACVKALASCKRHPAGRGLVAARRSAKMSWGAPKARSSYLPFARREAMANPRRVADDLVTVKEFFALASDDRKADLIDGVIYVTPPVAGLQVWSVASQ